MNAHIARARAREGHSLITLTLPIGQVSSPRRASHDFRFVSVLASRVKNALDCLIHSASY